MSLLLDALKKAGQGQQSAEPPSAAQPAAVRAAPRPEPAREAGKKLFSAKKKPAVRGRIQLGIVPIALIGGTVFAAGYGGYLWYELTPHQPAMRPVAHHQPPHAANPPPAAPLALASPPPATSEQGQSAPAQAVAPPAAPPHQKEMEAAPSPAVAMNEPAQERTAAQTPSIHIRRRQQPNSINPVLASAYRAYRQGNFAAAQQQYVAALKQDPKNRDALLGIAATAQQQGQDAIAAQYYRHVLALDPRDPVAYAGLAALSNDESPVEESRLKMLLAQQPKSAALNFALGNLYAGQQRWPEAQQAYFDAYSLQPDSADYALNLAISLDHLGHNKTAAQYYQRALQLSSNSKTSGFDRALVQRRLNALRAP